MAHRPTACLSILEAGTLAIAFLVTPLTACSPGPPDMYLPGDPDVTTFSVYHALGDYHPYRPVSIVADSPCVFIAEQQDAVIQILDWDLNPMRSIGRKGEGPGELSLIAGVDSRNDTLAVLDTWRMQVVLMSIDGGFQRSFAIPFSARWGFIDYMPSGNLLITNYTRASAFLANEFTTAGEWKRGFFDLPSGDYGITMGQAATMRTEDRLMALFIHQPLILVYGDQEISWNYRAALTGGYPFLRRLFRMQEKLQEQRASLVLYVFGRGVTVEDFLITPGPMYNLNVIDSKTGMLLVINTGDLSRQLGPWGYYAFDDLAIRGNTLLAVCSAASAVISMDLQQVMSAIESGEWLEPDIQMRNPEN